MRDWNVNGDGLEGRWWTYFNLSSSNGYPVSYPHELPTLLTTPLFPLSPSTPLPALRVERDNVKLYLMMEEWDWTREFVDLSTTEKKATLVTVRVGDSVAIQQAIWTSIRVAEPCWTDAWIAVALTVTLTSSIQMMLQLRIYVGVIPSLLNNKCNAYPRFFSLRTWLCQVKNLIQRQWSSVKTETVAWWANQELPTVDHDSSRWICKIKWIYLFLV